MDADLPRNLGCNQHLIREKYVKNLKNIFKKASSQESFNEESMMKLWSGAFYYFWNCDKPLLQEDRADVLSKYIHVFHFESHWLLYFDSFLQTMARKWLTIDRYRIDKFMSLIRKFLHESFVRLKNKKWNLSLIKCFKKILEKTVDSASDDSPLGLKIHIVEIYMEELAKVGSKQLSPGLVKTFVQPFCNILSKSDDPLLLSTIAKEIFFYLLNQDAEDGFQDFPVLQFDSKIIQDLLFKWASKPDVKKRNRKIMYNIIKHFRESC